MPRGHVLPDRDTIATLRGEAGLTQQSLADRTGYGVRTISKIESGQPTSSSTLAAIAIVLAESLRRPIHLVDLIFQPQSAARSQHSSGAAIIVGENVKLLELAAPAGSSSNNGSGRLPSRAVLVDTFRLRYVPVDLQQIDFYYATSAGTLSGRSLSHPAAACWLSAAEPDQAPRSGSHAADGHVLRIGLAPTASQRPAVVQNQLEFAGAFDGPEEQRFQTQVVHPTDDLTLLVRFPADRPFAEVRGRCRRTPGGPLLPVARQPLDLVAGRTAYWRIAAPTPGETYQLDWA
jgi:transcriptional regulator with XRE-family HTH domain